MWSTVFRGNGGIDYLNSADIESIEVLKDAALAHLRDPCCQRGYPCDNQNGKSGDMLVSYNAYFGTQAPLKSLTC
jgi:hypothetical protein